MAIMKMKKLRLMAVRSQKESLLRDMMLLDCVQITEPEQEMSEPSISAVVKRESSELTRYRSQHASLMHAVELLDRYAPAKGKLLAPKPEVGCADFLDDSALEENLRVAAKIEAEDDRIKRIGAEESRQRGIIESLKPWESLDLPMECTGTKRSSAVMGTVPGAADFGAIQAAVAAVTEEAELFLVSSSKEQRCMLLVCLKEDLAPIMETLREFSFTASTLTGMKGTAKENIARGEKTLDELAKEKQSLAESIAAKGGKRAELQLCSDRLKTRMGAAEAEDQIYGMDSAIALEGWVPEEKMDELQAMLDKYDCAWETEDPDEDEIPDVPVKLKNNRFSRPLNMVTEMYSLPAYDGVDPNPLMAPFFILFYGLMLADMAYGIIMIIAGLVVLKKKRPTGGMRNFFELMTYCGVATMLGGFITGGFFGNAIPTVAETFFHTPADQLPMWLQKFNNGLLFNPLDDTVYVLIGSMALGFIQIITGMVISFVEKAKAGHFMDGVWDEGTWWVIFAGIGLMVLKIGNIGGVPVVLCIGGLMLLVGSGRNSKGIGKVTAVFGALYNGVTGFFGDILSYSRIMALMLAGSVIAQVFNTLGAIPGNIIVFIIIFLFGHALNFALNLLGCYVHDLRLQCLEYFGKFYTDGGKPFTPLSIETKFYNVVK